MKQRSAALESIPGVGPAIARSLQSIGVSRVGDLKGKNPEKLYEKLGQTVGAHVDRCVLYVFRSAVYYANHQRHDPDKLKWWNWKDLQHGTRQRGGRRR
jgi:hypothetical protein